MQRLDADAALFVAVTQILTGDSELTTLLPGGAHYGGLALGTPLPALAWIVKSGGRRERNFGIVAGQSLALWFKVNTKDSDAAPTPFAGAAANARIRFLFDGANAERGKEIKAALEPLLRPRGWHLQGIEEEFPIPSSDEPLGADLTQMVTVVGGIYRVQMQPIP